MRWPQDGTVLSDVPAAHSRRSGGGSNVQRLQRTSSAKAISSTSTSSVQPSSTVMLAGAENVSLLSNQQGRPQMDLQRMLNADVLQQAKAQAALYSTKLPASQALAQRHQDVSGTPSV